jgi:hypothetical protein
MHLAHRRHPVSASQTGPKRCWRRVRRPVASKIQGDVIVNLSAPTFPIFVISLVLFLLAVIGMFIPLPFITGNALWLALIAYIVLLVGNVAKGL